MNCLHCNTTCSDEFCCIGCSAAYKLISKLNLNEYYNYCQKIYNRNPNKVVSFRNDLSYDEYISSSSDEDGITYTLNLLVEGIYCGSCVWLIEHTLKQYGAIEASINMSTNRLALSYKGDKSDWHKYINVIHELGYKLVPYTIDSKLKADEARHVDLLKRLFVAAFSSVAMTMSLWAVWIGIWDGSLGEVTRMMLYILSSIIAVPAICYSSKPFFHSAYIAIKNRHTNMDVPISLAIVVITFMSIYQTIINSEHVYYDAAISLLFFLLIGRFLDAKIRTEAMNTAFDIGLHNPLCATIFKDGEYKLIRAEHVEIGEVVYVNPGEKIPVDGIVIEGASEIDSSIISGETFPIAIKVGAFVAAGTVNLSQSIKVKASASGNNTAIAEIINLMQRQGSAKSSFVYLADKVARYYTFIVLILSVLTFAGWLYYGAGLLYSITSAVCVLIITCPCALALAAPIAHIIAANKLMKFGVIIKEPDALERICKIDKVFFDKTGTLTNGIFVVENISNISKDDLSIIKSMSVKSAHAISKSLAQIDVDLIEDIEVIEHQGLGLECNYKGAHYLLGSANFCGIEDKVLLNEQVIYFVNKSLNKLVKLILLDQLRSDAFAVVSSLINIYHLPVSIISGDIEPVVKSVSEALKINEYYAGVAPKTKYDIIKSNPRCLMVGDGLNDAASLKHAFVSIAPSSGIYISQTSSDFIVNKLSAIPFVMNIAKKCQYIIKQNFVISIAYNIVCIPIAVFGFTTPAIAAIAMSSSSIIVTLNSMRLLLLRR